MTKPSPEKVAFKLNEGSQDELDLDRHTVCEVEESINDVIKQCATYRTLCKLSIAGQQNTRKLVPFGKVTTTMIAYTWSAYCVSGRALSLYTLIH